MPETDHFTLQNPLHAWLRHQRMRYIDFARQVKRTEGCIARWCSGDRKPNPLDQEKIRIATNSAVRPEDWHAYFIARAQEAA